jgi:hypothetical protein
MKGVMQDWKDDKVCVCDMCVCVVCEGIMQD